jgi:hypothetical protein
MYTAFSIPHAFRLESAYAIKLHETDGFPQRRSPSRILPRLFWASSRVKVASSCLFRIRTLVWHLSPVLVVWSTLRYRRSSGLRNAYSVHTSAYRGLVILVVTVASVGKQT